MTVLCIYVSLNAQNPHLLNLDERDWFVLCVADGVHVSYMESR